MKKIELNYELIKDLEFDGIDHSDAPKFCDAYICAATYDGREMTENELDVLNQDKQFVNESLQDWLY